jgi:MoaA/NifB/PqqE/SkfB family radical SAM enzyme
MPSEPIATGWPRLRAKAGIWSDIFAIALRCYGNPWRAMRALRALGARRRMRGRTTYKYARAGKRWFWDLYSPGWPSPAFTRYIEAELNQSLPFRPARSSLQVLLMAITKACPLACEHCFEADSLNRAEAVDSRALEEILEGFLEQGAAQVQFSGGEPLRRFGDLLALAERARNRADTWIITSGWGLDAAKAAALRAAGLTGILLSVDDWDPARHDRFRGRPGAFAAAETAARAVRAEGLLLGLSLCATRAFATPENLRAYADLARGWEAGFIQIVEPKAVGGYAGRDVELGPGQIALLERFYLDLAYHPAYRGYPSAAYQGYAQRREGCGGAGLRYLYVDTDGMARACPFCREGQGSDCRTRGPAAVRAALLEGGCPRFPIAKTMASAEATPAAR